MCITSKYEGTPNVLGEAMSYKIPVLAPKNVGLVNYFLKNGKYGFLYKPGNSQSFQKQINYVITNYSEALKKANLGYQSLGRFSKKKTLGKIKYLIDKLN